MTKSVPPPSTASAAIGRAACVPSGGRAGGRTARLKWAQRRLLIHRSPARDTRRKGRLCPYRNRDCQRHPRRDPRSGSCPLSRFGSCQVLCQRPRRDPGLGLACLRSRAHGRSHGMASSQRPPVAPVLSALGTDSPRARQRPCSSGSRPPSPRARALGRWPSPTPAHRSPTGERPRARRRSNC